MGRVFDVPVARSSRRSATEIRPARHRPDLGKTRVSRSSRWRNASRGATSPTRSISEKSPTFRLCLRLNPFGVGHVFDVPVTRRRSRRVSSVRARIPTGVRAAKNSRNAKGGGLCFAFFEFFAAIPLPQRCLELSTASPPGCPLQGAPRGTGTLETCPTRIVNVFTAGASPSPSSGRGLPAFWRTQPPHAPVMLQRRYASINGSSCPSSTSSGLLVFSSLRVSFTNCSGCST